MPKPRGGGGTLYIWEAKKRDVMCRRGGSERGVEMRAVVGRRNISDRDYELVLYFCHSDLI